MAVLITFLGADAEGHTQRERRSYDQPLLRLGRSTECEVHLPDSRVALIHARLTIEETGATLHAEDAVVQVNGRETRTAKLKAGDRVFIGPYTLEVEAPRPGVPLALTVRHTAPPRTGRSWRRPFRNRLPVSRRRLSYIAFGTVLLLFLVVPLLGRMAEDREADAGRTTPALPAYLVSAVGDRFTQSWNPGPVSRAHAAFGDDCRACHRFPMVQVRDFSCIACHKAIGQHVSLTQLEGVLAAGMHERRCAQCHLDHKGERMAPRSQEMCADCHRDIKHMAPDAASGNATDFAANHPRFRLSLVDGDAPDKIRRVRLGTPVEERSNLKFNHALHLDPGGVRDPEGKRDARGMHDARGGRTILKCRSCHEATADGAALAPISMDKHCRSCHSLAFEPKLARRQVPHGSKEMETMLGEFYARLALRDVPPRAGGEDIQRARPGTELTYQDRQRVLQIAERNTREALRGLYEGREVCSTCHYVRRGGGKDGWSVAPVRLTRTWMPKARFDHAKHKTEQCTSCHDVTRSKSAKDVAMPDIANCRRCHVGAQPVRNKVTSDCATCHRFHASSEPWDPSLQRDAMREADQ